MDRRTFLRSAGATAVLTAATSKLWANVPVHSFDTRSAFLFLAMTEKLYRREVLTRAIPCQVRFARPSCRSRNAWIGKG